MRVTSLIDEARCYQALPITAKTIGHRTQDGTLNCRNEVSSSPNQNCAEREGERNCGNMERAKGFELSALTLARLLTALQVAGTRHHAASTFSRISRNPLPRLEPRRPSDGQLTSMTWIAETARRLSGSVAGGLINPRTLPHSKAAGFGQT